MPDTPDLDRAREAARKVVAELWNQIGSPEGHEGKHRSAKVFEWTSALEKGEVSTASWLLSQQELEAAKAESAQARNTIDDMMRCVGRNAGNIDDPVGVINMVYRELRQLRSDTLHQVERLAELEAESARWERECGEAKRYGEHHIKKTEKINRAANWTRRGALAKDAKGSRSAGKGDIYQNGGRSIQRRDISSARRDRSQQEQRHLRHRTKPRREMWQM